MGLDNFKTDSGSRSKSSNKSSNDESSSNESDNSSKSNQDVNTQSEQTDTMPWFTAVFDNRDGEVKTYEEDKAFLRRNSSIHQRYLVNIADEQDYKRIQAQFRNLKQCSITEFMAKDLEYAVDLIQRLKSGRLEEHTEKCVVCGEDVVMVGDDFLEHDGEPIHPNHSIEEVEDEVGVEA